VEFDEPRGRRVPIDFFFRSLAEQHGDGFAVILSGAGSDGAIGVRAVKEAGGIILVQEPSEAEYPSMPHSAIATGVADFVLPVAKLAIRLGELVQNNENVWARRSHDFDDDLLRRVPAHLRVRTGHDFSQYKRSTVLRRIARRMHVTRSDTLADFTDSKGRVPIIDKLPLGFAMEIVERVGALVEGGYRTNWQAITSFDKSPEEVRAIGFATLVNGRLDDALDRAYDGFRASGSDRPACLSTIYGWFWHWFFNIGGTSFSYELARALFRHAQGKIQISRSAFPVLPRDNHTITLVEAARMCRVRVGTLRKLLAAEGLIRREKRRGSPVMVQRAIAERMARDLADPIRLKSLADIIGVGGTSLVKLVRSGRVPVWMRGGCRQKHQYMFRRSEVIGWLRNLTGHATTVTVIPDGMITVADTPLAAHVAITVLVDAIASGQILVEAVLHGEQNLRGALVRLDAVKAYRKILGPETAKDPLRNYIMKTRVQSP
jgi:hypothetical protein